MFAGTKAVSPHLAGTVAGSRVVSESWWRQTLASNKMRNVGTLEFDDGSHAPLGKYLGSGTFGHVYCLDTPCARVIKLPTLPVLDDPDIYRVEQETSHALAAAEFIVALVIARGAGAVPYLVKDYVAGQTFREIQTKGFSDVQIKDLARIYVVGLRSGQHPDLLGSTKSNLVWHKSSGRWVLVDTGGETADAFFQPSGRMFRSAGELTSTRLLWYREIFLNRMRDANTFELEVQRLLGT